MNQQVLKYALLLDYPDLCQIQWSYYNILINAAEPGGLQLQRGRQDRATEHTRMHFFKLACIGSDSHTKLPSCTDALAWALAPDTKPPSMWMGLSNRIF